ncbi:MULTISPECIES: ABC transporter ATP-binding protein [unclassified Spirosoma]|uniref:ABC transporter ATP-binding protein n=1 Tax=unclassified Spirosoma TaxID=2621999 RepID=UPI000967831A|nr:MULTISPECIES: ABC transporter ATP-binding protein [unclassified Spirosoma]MBN8826594.1 ABC transporter ATP-binding protein [Spirosoma sp.]OJW72835.1 MAG: bacitracin ABC transporter ATP-binding protein [Spirosoma sp. 48-14]
MLTSIIQTLHLSYSFGNRSVLNDVSLIVPKGSIFGFLGPNGSGKTTTIRLLLGLIRSPENNISVFSKPINDHRLSILRRVGALIESPSLYPHLSGYANLNLTRLLLQVPSRRIDEVLDIVQLTADAHRAVREYSLGMKQRLSLAMSLLNNPELLILDEPTNGLDPAGIRDMRDLLLRLNRDEGKTIFVSSHLLSEIEKIVTHLAIINQGRLLFQGTTEELQQVHPSHVVIQTSEPERAITLLASAAYTAQQTASRRVELRVDEPSQLARINQLLVGQGIDVYGLQTQRNNLEDLFLNLTNAKK